MSRLKLTALFLVLSLCLAAPARAQVAKAFQDADQVGRSQAFNQLVKRTYVSLTSVGNVVTSLDTTSTNTFSLAYSTATVTAPLLLRVIQMGTATISYDLYAATTASGVYSHAATYPALINNVGANTGLADANGDVWEQVFYKLPTIDFSCGGSAGTFTIEIWKREADPYLP